MSPDTILVLCFVGKEEKLKGIAEFVLISVVQNIFQLLLQSITSEKNGFNGKGIINRVISMTIISVTINFLPLKVS